MVWAVHSDSSNDGAANAGSARGRRRGPPSSAGASRSRSRDRSSSSPSARRADDRHQRVREVLTTEQTIERPPLLRGAEWWQVPLWNSIEGCRKALPKEQTRCIVAESFCTGTMSEAYADKALGMFVCYQASCDTKRAAQKFVSRNHAVLYEFKDIESLTQPEPHLSEDCPETCVFPLCPVDLLRVGLPCQPFTRQRVKSKSRDEGPATGHSKWSVVFSTFFEYLQNRKPNGFVVENVAGFADRDPETGEPFMVTFMERAASYGYSCRAVELNSTWWVAMNRPRYYIVACSEALGHSRGADWVAAKIHDICRYRRLMPKQPVFQATVEAAEAAVSNKTRYSQWRLHAANARSKYNLSSTYDGWTRHPGVRGVPATPRIQDLVDTAWGCRVKMHTGEDLTRAHSRVQLARDFYVDCSQSVHREPWGFGLDTLTTTSQVYSYSEDVILTGQQHLSLMGMPFGQTPPHLYSDAECKSLAGEMYFIPSIATVTAAMYLNPWSPWWKPQGNDDEDNKTTASGA